MIVFTGATVAVAGGAVSLTVLGSFPLPYGVKISTSWVTDYSVTGQVATQFVVSFAVPAPAGATLYYEITIAGLNPVGTGSAILAGAIVNAVRDEVPDPVYDSSGNPLPDTDGSLFRASSLYRWLDDGVRIMARACGAVIEDWTAVAQKNLQPWYALDPKFLTVDDAFSNLWPIDTISLTEGDVIWPTKSLTTAQSLWGYKRKRGDHLEFGLWPVPNATDPSTTLTNDLPLGGVDPIIVGSTTGFLNYGYIQIDNEIIQYQSVVSATSVGTISRGQCGTTIATHLAGATVQSLGLFVKGKRSPGTISTSASIVELPPDIEPYLELYLLARCRRSENEHEEARKLMGEFSQACKEINADPNRKENQGQIRAYGERPVGPLAWSGQVIRP